MGIGCGGRREVGAETVLWGVEPNSPIGRLCTLLELFTSCWSRGHGAINRRRMVYKREVHDKILIDYPIGIFVFYNQQTQPPLLQLPPTSNQQTHTDPSIRPPPPSIQPTWEERLVEARVTSSSHFCSSGFSLHMFLKLRLRASKREMVV